MSIYTCHQTLGSRLFITGGSVYLTGHKQTFYISHFKRRLQLSRVEIIVLDSIGGTVYFNILKPFDRMKSLELYVKRQG